MNLRIFIALQFLCLSVMAGTEKFPLIPIPQTIVEGNGYFQLDSSTTFFVPENFKNEASLFVSYVKANYNVSLPFAEAKSPDRQISVRQAKVEAKGVNSPDVYSLEVSPSQIQITVTSPAAMLYAFETLKQLLPPVQNYHPLKVPCVSIQDAPKYQYRGMHLDVVRHFYSKEFVKKYLDWMLMYKMNVFHWHLTDDQGWRIEIKKYPNLTKTGAYRKGTLIGHYSTTPQQFDTLTYGGFYTQDDIREIVKYAADRHITIIPEIEMPGHATAAIAAYPELGCAKSKVEVAKSWGVFYDIFCPTEQTFTFLENVLTEVAELFPGQYIHIGGDEVPKDRWKASAFCQQLMKEKNLKDEEELQHYFTNRIISFLKTKNKIGIGWDEIMNDKLDSSAMVLSWRGFQGGAEAAKKGHDVIMAPYSHVYFDMYQTRNPGEEIAIGGYTPLSKVYSFEPMPDSLTAEQARHVLGAEACVWTEYITTEKRVQEMIVPRMAALAEVLWSTKQNRNFDSFTNRMAFHLKYLKFRKINFSSAIFEINSKVTAAENGGVFIELSEKNSKGDIHYTLDGSSPEITSPVYSGKIKADQSVVLKAVLMNGGIKMSEEFNAVFKLNRATGTQVTLISQPFPDYSNGGAFSLVDGMKGRIPSWLGDEWLGFFNTNFEAIVDLGKEVMFARVTLDMLNDSTANIHYPKSITVSSSNDNVNWTVLKTLPADKVPNKSREVRIEFPYTKSRYVKIMAENGGGYLFLDEIGVD